ncbi:integration host factor subunit alpha [Candidatus Odyssella acanthamoebae]|uniref:Integration host factor subunit alpha n=1 Tax=Candidatus Odyssella acanthamoebae TaxID=91604 RepID=A0A077ARC9_9PROT|nr:integration host factor subunit alpha [Candidatus Paracaedibacter acanthamoebae]AIK95747.1 integration host factor subunit alpha [Candidatus Paracaedibacter acanthamoebae]
MANNTITRADLVNSITENLSVPKPVASDVLESVLDVISKTLAKGDSVKISSFGTFNVRKKTERIGRNPRTGIEAKITARSVISFKASPIFKDTVKPAALKKAA